MRRVQALDVACPSCGSSPGRGCRRLTDEKHTAPHPARRRRARDENLRLNPEHVHGQLPLWSKR